MLNGGGGILDSAREEIQSMEKAVAFSDSWLSEVRMQKLDGFGE